MIFLIELDSGSYPGEKCYIRMTPYGALRVLTRSHATGWSSEADALSVLRGLRREAIFTAPEQMSPGLCERLKAAEILTLTS